MNDSLDPESQSERELEGDHFASLSPEKTNELYTFQLDESLYTPSIPSKEHVHPDRRLYNPLIFPYIGFFLPFWLWIPVCINFAQSRRWVWTAFGIMLNILGLLLWFLISPLIVFLLHIRMRTVGYYTLPLMFVLLGLLMHQAQKQDFRRFLLYGGRPHNFWILVAGLAVLDHFFGQNVLIYVADLLMPFLKGIGYE